MKGILPYCATVLPVHGASPSSLDRGGVVSYYLYGLAACRGFAGVGLDVSVQVDSHRRRVARVTSVAVSRTPSLPYSCSQRVAGVSHAVSRKTNPCLSARHRARPVVAVRHEASAWINFCLRRVAGMFHANGQQDGS